jgi:hypothetical protein
MSKFIRDYELFVGKGGKGLLIKDLRVQFDIKKDLFGIPNLAQITIFNLSEASRSLIEDEYEEVIFNLGYRSGLSTVFQGEIRNAFHIRDGVDMKTVLYCGDGDKVFRTGYVSLSIEAPRTPDELLDEVVRDVTGAIKGFVGGVDKTAKNEDGVVLEGLFNNVMDSIAKESNSDWSIQDGKVQMLGYDSVLDKTALVISSLTGMIGSPTITEKGVEVKQLIVPDVVPGQAVEIESQTTSVNFGNLFFSKPPQTQGTGIWKVVKSVMLGDTHASQFEQTLTCRKYNG